MATLIQILSYKFAGTQWRMDNSTGDDYPSLTWLDPTPKPTEAAIRAFSAEVDTLLAADARTQRQVDAFDRDALDVLLRVLEIIVAFEKQLANKIRPQSLTVALDTTALDALITKLQAIRDNN